MTKPKWDKRHKGDRKVAKLIHAELETCSENNDGSALALYFEGTPTKREILAACSSPETKRLTLSVDTDDEFFAHSFQPNALSTYAKLVRVEATPVG